MSKNLGVFFAQPWFKSLLLGLGVVLVIAVVVTPRVLDLNIFYARDELAIWPWADQFTLAVWQGDPAATLTGSNYPGIPMFWVQTLFLTLKYRFPALFAQTAIPLEELSQHRSLDLLAERRLAAGLLVSLQILLAVWLVSRLFKGWTAILAAILLGLDPFSLSEARLLRLEMVSALFAGLSVLAYLLYLPQRQRRWLLLSGVMAGLGVSSKASAGLIVPYIGMVLVLDFWFDGFIAAPGGTERPWLNRFKRMVLDGLVWAGGAMAAFWLIWPAMWVKPLEAIQYIFLSGLAQATDRSVWGDTVFFWGQVIEGGDPGPFFYPVVFVFRTTPLLWLGLIAALGVWGWSSYKLRITNYKLQVTAGQSPSVNHQAKIAAIGLLLAFVILVWLELSLVVSKVDRFLLLLFPVLNILGAIGLGVLLEWIATRWSRFTPHAVMVPLLVGVLALQLTFTLPAHPYYFTYWNPWVGGGRAAMGLLPIGAGEGIDQAMSYLNAQPDAVNSTLVCGASEPWCKRTFQGQTLRSASYFDGRWLQADYASFYISQLQRQSYPPEVVDFFKPQTPLYQVSLQGVDYVSVYPVPKIDHLAGRYNDLAGLGRLLGYNLAAPVSDSPAGITARVGDTVKATLWWVNWGAGVNNLVMRWVDETGYEWGRTRVTPLPEYAAIAPERRAVVVGTAGLVIPPGTPPGLYFLRVGISAPGEERLLGEFTLPDEANKLVVTPGLVQFHPDLAGITHRVDQLLAPEIRLLGYNPPGQALTAVAPTWLTLYWQATMPPSDYRVALRLLNSADQEVTRWQGDPGQGRYPTQNWRAGEMVKDVWALQVPPETPVGSGYSLEISLTGPGQSEAKMLIPNLEVLPQPVHYNLPEMQAKLNLNFGNRLTLLGYDLFFDTDGVTTGQLAPTFYWQSQADLSEAFDLRLTLRAADTNQVVKEWRVPLGAGEAKTVWKAGEVVNTIYQLDLEAVVNGRYHLDIGLDNQTTRQPEKIEPADTSDPTFARIEDIQDKMVVRLTSQ